MPALLPAATLNSKRLTISRHIDDKSEEVYEGRKNTGKHVITIDNDLFDELSRLHIFQERKDGFAPDTYMFGVIKPLPHQSINNHFAKMVKLSGNKKIRIHDLRHSHVSWLISIGCTPSEAAARIGDSVEQVYRTYLRAHREIERLPKMIHIVEDWIEETGE